MALTSKWWQTIAIGDTTGTETNLSKPLYYNDTGYAIELSSAVMTGYMAASATDYYTATIKDSGGNTIVAKSMAAGIGYTGYLAFGTLSTTYYTIDAGETIYLLLTQAGNGAVVADMKVQLIGTIVRGVD